MANRISNFLTPRGTVVATEGRAARAGYADPCMYMIWYTWRYAECAESR
jgi:hypothetical protein